MIQEEADMAAFANEKTIEMLSEALNHERALPDDPAAERLVYWHVFRRPEEVLGFARKIQLASGEMLVGGQAEDSIGKLWWVGVRVDDLEAWGSRRAIKKVDGVDPENADSPML